MMQRSTQIKMGCGKEIIYTMAFLTNGGYGNVSK